MNDILIAFEANNICGMIIICTTYVHTIQCDTYSYTCIRICSYAHAKIKGICIVIAI